MNEDLVESFKGPVTPAQWKKTFNFCQLGKKVFHQEFSSDVRWLREEL